MDKCYNKCGGRRLFYIIDFECGNERGDYIKFWVCEKCLYHYIDLEDDFDNPHYLILKEATQFNEVIHKTKRQYTKPIFQSIGASGTGIQISLIKNKSKGRKFDVIEFLIKHLGNDGKVKTLLFNSSPEEALELAWGINKVVWDFLTGFEPYQKFRMEGAKTKFNKKSIWWSL